MEAPWHYLVNQFVNTTEGSYKKALQLSMYHNSALQQRMTDDPGDPDWATLYNRYNPFHVSYAQNYTQWKTADGSQQGHTLGLDQMLAELPMQVDSWDSQVKSVPGFAKGSANHQALFPYGRKPFNTGSKNARIEAVNTLAEAMAPFPALSAVTGVVSIYYTQLLAARNTQTGAISNTKFKSKAVELNRVAVMTEQYRNLGFMIDKAADNPEFIAPLFDLNVLRQSDQERYTGTLIPGETEAVLIHTFMDDDRIKVFIDSAETVPSGTMVQLYLATIPLGTDSTPVQVEADAAAVTIDVTAFGITDYHAHRYLTAVNTNGIPLEYVVELL